MTPALLRATLALAKALGIGARRCGWCKKYLGLKWFGWGRGCETSHGICPPCKTKWDKEAGL